VFICVRYFLGNGMNYGAKMDIFMKIRKQKWNYFRKMNQMQA